MACIAEHTQRCMIGSSIAYGVGRTPLMWAAEARDLDELSGGRLSLGIGNGTARMMEDWHGVSGDAPALRMEEFVEVVRKLWRLCDGPVEHQGRFYKVDVRPTIDVAPPLTEELPIMTAGVNPRMIEAAGRVADGLWAHPMFTELYHEAVVRPALSAGAARSGRDPSLLRVYAPIICVLNDEVDVARWQLKYAISQYAASRVYDRLFELHGWTEHQSAIKQAVRGGDRQAMALAVPDEVADQIGIACIPSDLGSQLPRHAAPLDHVSLTPAPWSLSPAEHVAATEAIIRAVAAIGEE
jgi:alkanesulfonate monooxygenase SsuD/methylene tetrahydromethanopterin reductase-like flavin-dependent oxidoreductase (luciferase family)